MNLNTLILVLVGVFSTTQARDFIRHSFRVVDENADPCENFYRHACPQNIYLPSLINSFYGETLSNLKAKQNDKFWNNLGIYTTLTEANVQELPGTLEYVRDLFQIRCEEGDDTRGFLEYVQRLFLHNEECYFSECLVALADDQNCTRATEILEKRISPNIGGPIAFYINSAIGSIRSAKNILVAVSTILDGDLREGVDRVGEIVEDIIEKVEKWIEKTPWAVNNQAVDSIKAEIDQLTHFDNYAIILRENLDMLSKVEQIYLNCLKDIGDETEELLFCAVVAGATVEPVKTAMGNSEFFNFFNALNGHPYISFSYHFYDIAKNVEEFAAVLGSAGQVIGHEISHTLIEDANDVQLLPVFSNESMQCITNQFNKTCNTFIEESCFTGDWQIDENGSDILGRQLAYSLLEEYYGDRLQNEYISLQTTSVTYQQLFFYAYAFMQCSGLEGSDKFGRSHSAPYIRVNAIAQHPGFQEAFQCSVDSKMMQSVEKECIIFGEGAPEAKRH